MKNVKSTKKLQLTRESVVQLGDAQLHQVNGGSLDKTKQGNSCISSLWTSG